METITTGNKHSFYAILNACIYISDHDFKILLQASSNHYDHKVQSLSMVGGFLYGAHNRRNFDINNEELKEENLSCREIGLLLKSLEMVNTNDGRFMYERLYKIAMELNSKQEEINKTLNK